MNKASQKHRARWPVPLVLIVVAGLIAYGFLPEPIAVESHRISKGRFEVSLTEEGRTRVTDRYEILTPTAGMLERIELDVGDHVTEGQVVAWLTPSVSNLLDARSVSQTLARIAALEAHCIEAEHAVDAASAQLEQARLTETRVRELLEKGGSSQQDVDLAHHETTRLDAEHQVALARVEAARQELNVERARLAAPAVSLDGSESTDGDPPAKRDDGDGGASSDGPPAGVPTSGELRIPLRAPSAGRVLHISREDSGPVSAGASLIVIGDPTRLEIEVDLLSEDATRISPGMRVAIERWGGDEPLEARVRTVEPAGFLKVSALGVEEQRVLVIADFVSPPAKWRRLGDAYRIEARFILSERESALQVPTAALFRVGDAWAVFVVHDERAVQTKIELGDRSGLIAEVRSGLSPSDLVVVHPPADLSDGDRVAATLAK